MTGLADSFLAIAAAARIVTEGESGLDNAPLASLDQAAEQVGKSWSKSNLGYQANVYYSGFKPPPAGHIFSREWGFQGQFNGSIGDWRQFEFDQVIQHIRTAAGNPDLTSAQEVSGKARVEATDLLHRARSAAARLPLPYDDYLREAVENLYRISLPEVDTIATSLANITNGPMMVRDTSALEGGWQIAGHQRILAETAYLRSPFVTAGYLAESCQRIGAHLKSLDEDAPQASQQVAGKIFIGHGGLSLEYLKLGVWLTDQGLDWDVFDRKPTAGLSTLQRLSEMLDNAPVAFLIMSGEDETADGKTRARENVVHEVGLFQGRLGFQRAIVLLEEGCDEFSNIIGLGQIRFPKGNIKAAFDEVRQVLQREGILK